jgi:hypothetical protein
MDFLPHICTRYGLDGLAIESRYFFRICPDRHRRPPSPLYKGFRVLHGCKTIGAWYWRPTPSSAEVAKELELILHLPPGYVCIGMSMGDFTFVAKGRGVGNTNSTCRLCVSHSIWTFKSADQYLRNFVRAVCHWTTYRFLGFVFLLTVMLT